LKVIELLMDIENPRTKKQVANEVGFSHRAKVITKLSTRMAVEGLKKAGEYQNT